MTIRTTRRRTLESAANAALGWLRANELPGGGIRIHSHTDIPYPEVTGYIIPTFIDRGRHVAARRLAEWLLAVQGDDGAFAGPDGIAYTFDTAQALRGLLAVPTLLPEAQTGIMRAVRYLDSRFVDEGRGGFVRSYAADPDIPESIHLYALAPLLAAAPELQDRVRACADYYAALPEALDAATLTHFLAYELDGLIELGRADVAQPVLERLARDQATNGSIRARAGADWTCTPGVAQLAICWLKLGKRKPAARALDWLRRRQERSGGFRGSYGRGASYFATVEPAWAPKFFLDAEKLATS